MIEDVRRELREQATPGRAKASEWFFKTGPGEYGEGDLFLGVTMPDTRKVAKKHKDLALVEVEVLLESKWHEERMMALVIIVNQYKKAEEPKQKELFDFYLNHTERINNWDLVDVSARDITGAYIFHHPELIPRLDELAESDFLWERRIAVISTFYFINQGDPTETIKLAGKLLNDPEDLMHKAVGWMLREMGKRVDRQLLIDFLDEHAHEMPRTMLRYSIEHLDENTRKKYLAK